MLLQPWLTFAACDHFSAPNSNLWVAMEGSESSFPNSKPRSKANFAHNKAPHQVFSTNSDANRFSSDTLHSWHTMPDGDRFNAPTGHLWAAMDKSDPPIPNSKPRG